MAYSEGDTVRWNWGNGTGADTVTAVHASPIARTIGGAEITRNASGDNPAYLIGQRDGAEVLKSHSELESA